jgi:hypothetical protein
MDDKIREWLGLAARPFRFTLGGQEHRGWKAPAHRRDEAWAAQAGAALRDDGVRVYVGDNGDTVYALTGVGPLDVIERADVGAQGRDVDWRDVRGLLERAAIPCDVTFADEGGLEAVFREPIDPRRARALAQEVLDRSWMDSICLMGEEGEGFADALGPDDRSGDGLDLVVAYIVGRNAVRLWWD